ncbi:MAG: OB-fold domain-containing protein [Halieaceae bacterium]
MSDKPLVPAIEGWYTMNTDKPHLIGSCCTACGTYFFPSLATYCKNPDCDNTEFKEVELSRTGTIWSYTNACYQPPEPFVAPEPFEPYAIAAVQLEQEQMVVLGQVAKGFSVEDLKVGMAMELVLEVLHEDEEESKVTWKWKPVSAEGVSA